MVEAASGESVPTPSLDGACAQTDSGYSAPTVPAETEEGLPAPPIDHERQISGASQFSKGSKSPSLGATVKALDFIVKLKMKSKQTKKTHTKRRTSAFLGQVHLEQPKPLVMSSLQIIGMEKLGEGTSGRAFRVHNELDEREYCVKVVPLQDDDDVLRKTVATEAKIHSKLNHEGVVKYCYSWMDKTTGGTQFYMLLELCDSDLWTCLEKSEPPVEERRRWSLQLSGALEHIHAHDIVHRDLNPWNVLVTHGRDLKVGDFGLSVQCKSTDMLSGMETDGAVPLDSSAVGSLYSAPELGQDYNSKADVFSLGMTLFAIWYVGDMSEDDDAEDDLICKVEELHESGELPEGFAERCPIADIIRRMVVHAPEERLTAAAANQEVCRALSSFAT
jgi:hypothetical protein